LLNLVVKWIDTVSPAAMQKKQRHPLPKLPVMNR
jgi:hypothetical protein